MTSNDLKFKKLQKYDFYVYQMKASNPGNVKTAMVYIIDPLVTSNDLYWPLMTSKLEIAKLQLYVYQMAI